MKQTPPKPTYVSELTAALARKRLRSAGYSIKEDARVKKAKKHPLKPSNKILYALTQGVNAFANGVAHETEKLVLSQLPIVGSGDPLDRQALEAGLIALEAKIDGMAEVVRPKMIKAAHRAEQEAWKAAESLLKVDLPVRSSQSRVLFAERAVTRLKHAGRAQVNLIRRAILDYKEGSSMRRAILDTLWLSKARSRMVARDELWGSYRQAFAEAALLSGSTEGIYVTARDERVRAGHRALEGKMFSWANPPLTFQEPNCRCSLVPAEVLE